MIIDDEKGTYMIDKTEDEFNYMEFARRIERIASNFSGRISVLRFDNEKERKQIEVFRFVGALLSMASACLCELCEYEHPIDKEVANGILREWGVDELC